MTKRDRFRTGKGERKRGTWGGKQHIVELQANILNEIETDDPPRTIPELAQRLGASLNSTDYAMRKLRARGLMPAGYFTGQGTRPKPRETLEYIDQQLDAFRNALGPPLTEK